MTLGWKIVSILGSVDTRKMSLQNLGDYLRDKLADAKEKGQISSCGCDGEFRLDEMDYGYDVYMEVNKKMTKFMISMDSEFIGGGPNADVQYEIVSFEDAIDGYGEIQYNEYIDDRPHLTEEDLESFINGDEYNLK